MSYARIADQSGVCATAGPFSFQIRKAGIVGRSQRILSYARTFWYCRAVLDKVEISENN
jgi:hypothetical protein